MSSTAGAVRRSEVAMDRELAAALWLVLLALACVLAVFLTWRRLAGALVQPPSGWALVITSLALASLAALLRWLWGIVPAAVMRTQHSVLSNWLGQGLALPSSSAASSLRFAAPGLAAILLLAALTLPGTQPWGVAAAWFLLIGAESTSWLLRRRTMSRQEPAAADESEIPAGLVQQLMRVREAGRESIHAVVGAEFAAHDSLALVHIAFCPPLASRPALTAHAVDAEVSDIRIAQAETFGARIEVRRSQAIDQPQTVLVEVLGSATGR